ncbi:MAG: class I SAM-dependent methyltransferase [Gammaproteobacteria bacterium]|nr:class I SAM-dependent methyltransferase [Gammaproteobacteria bacterium]
MSAAPNDNLFEQIDASTNERYQTRFTQHGESHLTLGWGSREQQAYRFSQLLYCADFTNRSVLDIGCGFGDLLGYLHQRNIPLKHYVGIDVNPEFIRVAAETYPEAEFHAVSLTSLTDAALSCDLVVMLGLLNFRQQALDNPSYAWEMVRRAYALSQEALLCDFLSSQREQNYPPEDFVYYYDPAFVLELGLECTPNVQLKHDYRPIPQREMLLTLRR